MERGLHLKIIFKLLSRPIVFGLVVQSLNFSVNFNIICLKCVHTSIWYGYDLAVQIPMETKLHILKKSFFAHTKKQQPKTPLSYGLCGYYFTSLSSFSIASIRSSILYVQWLIYINKHEKKRKYDWAASIPNTFINLGKKSRKVHLCVKCIDFTLKYTLT